MSTFLGPRNEPQLQPRNPDTILEDIVQELVPALVPRQAATTSTSDVAATVSCGPKDTTGPCERSVSSQDNTTIPIILGVVLPLGVAFVVFIVLHRRHVKKLRQEDAEDRHKSLDFGLGEEGGRKARNGKKSRKEPEMSMADTRHATRRDRGLSMDMGMTHPYLLPPELQQSRESLHSLSRSGHAGDDKYRNTTFIPDDGSVRSPSGMKRHGDDSSSFTASTRLRLDSDPSSQPLVKTSTGGSGKTQNKTFSYLRHKPLPPPKHSLLPPPRVDIHRDSTVSTTSDKNAAAAFRKSNNYLGAFIRGGGDKKEKKKDQTEMPPKPTVNEIKVDPPVEEVRPPPRAVIKDEPQPPPPPPATKQDTSGSRDIPVPSRIETAGTPKEDKPQARIPQLSFIDSYTKTNNSSAPEISITEPSEYDPQERRSHMRENYEEEPSPQHSQPYDQQHSQPYDQQHSQPYDQQHSQPYDQQHSQQYDQQQAYAPEGDHMQYSTLDDYYDEEDTYSVYDDYIEELGYDPRRLTMGVRPLPPDDPSENPEQRANRIRSFYKEYFDESNRSPNPNQYTGYYDGSEQYDYYGGQNYYGHGHGHYPPRGPSADGYGRHRATVSNGSYMPGSRAYSSASGRYGHPGYRHPGPRMPPRKRMAPPKPLHVLPTPHKLKQHNFMPNEFAPPNMAKMQRAGTPDSLRGGVRPYSPGPRAHTPLVSAFDDLAMMPSPHQLRKSATFTALDFAPPRRLPGGDSGSDTGSIRSNRSGMSAQQLNHIRNGAYRLSRVPKEVAGSKNELAHSLRPKWDMNR